MDDTDEERLSAMRKTNQPWLRCVIVCTPHQLVSAVADPSPFYAPFPLIPSDPLCSPLLPTDLPRFPLIPSDSL